ncbi:HAD-IB family phosphatase [Chitinophaga silvisoli]|uniref:D-3-phosphoglycerate dehydrogenase n=1 Tax=Chitinophaga silvisoli TaxID=2291814 RepID=A0A3E1NSZ6_9BACT|nr:HAD-IB family phosphatase [Chitinophaga silvisoli]RFM31040.1 phosphoserine phosphatase [Chitinophaga silvisoli]
MNKNYYIIDFDSTFTQVEALDELARISLQDHPDREAIYRKIEELTNLAMEGKLSFRESLSGRVKLLEANKEHLGLLIKHLKKQVSVSFSRNKKFFKHHADDVLIVSGGFKEFITPVVLPYHIRKENIYANTFVFDADGKIIGFDEANPLSDEGGKVKLLKDMQLSGDIYGIGDGHSDFQLKEFGMIKKFFAFTENIKRKAVAEKADHVTPSFDEFLYVNNLPSALSYPKNRITCVVIGEVEHEAVHFLKKDGFAIETGQEAIADAGILLVAGGTKVDLALLEQAPKLKVIGYMGNGSEQIDYDACTTRGIVVFDNLKKSLSVAKRVAKFINNGDTFKSSNFPHLQLPEVENAHRLIGIHHNAPGMIAKVNQVFAERGINIISQFLMTNSKIGYVITDVTAEYDKQVLKGLKEIEGTIKFRYLY